MKRIINRAANAIVIHVAVNAHPGLAARLVRTGRKVNRVRKGRKVNLVCKDRQDRKGRRGRGERKGRKVNLARKESRALPGRKGRKENLLPDRKGYPGRKVKMEERERPVTPVASNMRISTRLSKH